MDPEEYKVIVTFVKGSYKSYQVVGRDMTLPGWVVLNIKSKDSVTGYKAVYINKDTIAKVNTPLFLEGGQDEPDQTVSEGS